MKKLLAVLLAAVTALSLCLPAFSSAVPVKAEIARGEEVGSGDYAAPFDDSRFFRYGDYTIHFREIKAENEKGRIMMIHGFALSGYCWNELAARLVAEGYTCVIPDLPDFGYSTRETAATERLPREDIIYGLMTFLYDGQWIVAGHSMGGFIALSLMQKHPESVKALMLFGTSGNDGMSDGVKNMFTLPVVTKVMGAFMDLCASCDLIFDIILRYALQDDEYYAAYDKAAVKEPARIKGTGAGAVYSFASLNPTDFEALRTCGKPIFYINGSRDNVIGRSARDKLSSFLPADAVNVTVEGGGHMFIENKADEVAAATLLFLGR